VENLTHSLVGAALAELALPATAARAHRRAFFIAGVVAANLPDADLLYTRIAPAPLGYLLHHRGHTHTVVGLLAQAALVALVCALPAIRRRIEPLRRRFAVLVGLALASHLLLDSWNSYGVHPFWPVDARWFYGDAIYILEPWLWLPLGLAAAANAHRRSAGVAIALLVAALVGTLAVMRMTPSTAVVALALAAAAMVLAGRHLASRHRAAAALATVALWVAAMFAIRESAQGMVGTAMPRQPQSRVLDVVLSPSPGNPLCWNALAITLDASAGSYRLTRGTASPLAAWGCGKGRQRVEWEAPIVQSADSLRALARRDCWVRAWLQFGRAPEISGGFIADARYGGTARDNFSTMMLRPGSEAGRCPARLTAWGMPRGDLLSAGP